jgi:hypothetical protein
MKKEQEEQYVPLFDEKELEANKVYIFSYKDKTYRSCEYFCYLGQNADELNVREEKEIRIL